MNGVRCIRWKKTLQILVGFVFVAQLAGCFFVERDHRRDHDSSEHHEHEHDHDSGIDVRVHGD